MLSPAGEHHPGPADMNLERQRESQLAAQRPDPSASRHADHPAAHRPALFGSD